jgi:hypothetical protein
MLTKTDFLIYMDTPLHLWAWANQAVDGDVPGGYERFLMEQGKEIENIAKAYIEEYILPRYGDTEKLWQPTYSDGNFVARADAVLFNQESGAYDLYEIKSATGVSKEHLYDIAYQRLVCEASIPVGSVYLIHLDKDYVRRGEMEPERLLTVEQVDEQVIALRDEVLTAREQAWRVLEQSSPAGISGCIKPKTCPCPQLCHPDLPEHPIYEIAHLHKNKAWDLISRGITAIQDIPPDYPLSEKQDRQVRAVKFGTPWIDMAAIRLSLDQLQYPLNFLDYETFNPGIPLYDGYRPYEHIVFQYSLHVLAGPTIPLHHYEHLTFGEVDPGPTLLAQLEQALGGTGSVIVWNKTFETSRNREMAARYPVYAGFLEQVNQRIYDLADVFRLGHYLHPDFKGSYSIKNVLPVLVPSLSYEDMEVAKGDDAMMAFWRLVNGELSSAQVESTRRSLLAYCQQDTLAMVEIWRILDSLS